MTDETKYSELRQKSNKVIGPDGVYRSAQEEDKLNEMFHIVFRGAVAEKLLDYLRSISTGFVSGPQYSSDALRHLEGQRYHQFIIERRLQAGRLKERTGKGVKK